MSYTRQIRYVDECNYINPESQNAIAMLNNCVNNPVHNYVLPNVHNYKVNPLCYSLNPNPTTDLSKVDLSKQMDDGVVEGFVNYPSFSDNKPGEFYVEKYKCPEGYTYECKTGMCKKVCQHCSQDKYNSYSYKYYEDVPYYNGIDNEGNATYL